MGICVNLGLAAAIWERPMAEDSEERLAGQLVEEAIAAGYVVTVDDGRQNLPIKKSSVKWEILEVMFKTGRDNLMLFQRHDNSFVGTIVLKYGANELIAGFTDNPETVRVIELAKRHHEMGLSRSL
jgi:hypothetical protein